MAVTQSLPRTTAARGPAVSVRDLVKEYEGKPAVRGVSFDVPRGIVFTLVGPNGAGKTSTIEMIESIRTPTTGQIDILGFDAIRQADEVRHRIGALAQEFYAFDRLTVRETLRYFALLYDHPLSIDRVVDLLELREHEKTYFARLSGGLKRRVGIGAAIVNDPDVVFLDEPTSGVDPLGRRAIWRIIQNIRKAGKTVFLTTHYMDEAEALSDVVAVIDHGRIIALGHPDELIARHGGTRSIVLRGIGSEHLAKARRLSPAAHLNGDDSLVLPVSPDVDLARLLKRLERAAIPTKSVLLKEPSLDDVFIALTSGRRKGRRRT